ncbi:hypothetical protein AB0M58_41830 [Streptomyces bobili]|uniref:hypothetical protein n=1 Tax=Streptomyces bobili TaxID=67280 RepID=UPI0034433A54
MSTPPGGGAVDTAGHQTTSAPEFDRLFGTEERDSVFSTIARLVDPDLPPDLDLFSFLCADLLHHIARQLDLTPGRPLPIWAAAAAVPACGSPAARTRPWSASTSPRSRSPRPATGPYRSRPTRPSP